MRVISVCGKPDVGKSTIIAGVVDELLKCVKYGDYHALWKKTVRPKDFSIIINYHGLVIGLTTLGDSSDLISGEFEKIIAGLRQLNGENPKWPDVPDVFICACHCSVASFDTVFGLAEKYKPGVLFPKPVLVLKRDVDQSERKNLIRAKVDEIIALL